MKKSILFILAFLSVLKLFPQGASRQANSTATVAPIANIAYIAYIDTSTVAFEKYRILRTPISLLSIKSFSQIVGLTDSLSARYTKTQVNGMFSSVTVQWANVISPPDFLLTSSFTPLFNSALSLKTTSDLTEGSNLYYTTSRFNSAFGTKTTTELSEGSNLYYTSARFNSAFSSKSTTDLVEGTNMYYTTARFNLGFAGKTTSDLTEGSNLYYTIGRFNTAFSSKSTTDLSEGTNQYFTNARSRNAISLTTTGAGASAYNSSTGVLNIPISPRIERLTGTTNASGIVTFTFTAFSVVPNIQAQLVYPAGNKETIIPNAASTATSCSYIVQLRSDVLGLLPSYAPVNGREVNVLAIEK